MPSSAEHQAKHLFNRAFLDSGVAAANPAWAAVVAFYAAVHLVERLAAVEPTGPVHHKSHQGRENWLAAHRKHRAVIVPYMELKDASEVSRYGTIGRFDRQYRGDYVQRVLIDTHLVAIENHVAGFFAPPQLPQP